ncbi:MAG: fibronectin type III-like domain-contianing protein [Gammaproteobacteria bacterium]
MKARFPFGFGLSYTAFDYSDLALSATEIHADDGLTVRVSVRNTGPVAGKEVVQLYVSDPECVVYRPERELKAFTKVRLEPGETRTVTFELNRDAFAFFDAAAGRWVVEGGEFIVEVGASSADIRVSAAVRVHSDDVIETGPVRGPACVHGRLQVDDAVFAEMLGKPVPAPQGIRPFHLNSSVDEIATTWLGRLVKGRIVAGVRARMGGAGNDEVLDKMFEIMAGEMPLRGIEMFSGGQIRRTQLELLVAVLNWRLLEALRLLFMRADLTGERT